MITDIEPLEKRVVQSVADLTKEDLIKVVANLLDGRNQWYDIQTSTGMREETSKAVENIGQICIEWCSLNGWE